ncbi:MAG: trypsin-like peptidase domain-containing protein [Desulfobacteraceae bacterium]|nr:trypsin-like peptidase domain-containing protein [Desulfobacteraceae bacterium]
MKCPKCGHEQESDFECFSCGIIFEKYLKSKNEATEKSVFTEIATNSEVKSKNKVVIPAIVIFFLILFFSVKSLMFNNTENNEINITKASEEIREKKLNGIAQKLHEYKAPRNNIEESMLATVFIETPWGFGSGFFADEKCNIITNKHVVEFDDQKIKQLELQIDFLKTMTERHENQITRYKKDLEYQTAEDQVLIINKLINDTEQRLEILEKQLHIFEEKFNQVRFGTNFIDLKIILFDNSEYLIREVEISEKHDLALLRLDEENCPCLKVGSTDKTEIGSKVYTVGSPSGLTYTVTSGIISGIRKNEDEKYIQTDAPINPGNSGGPLLDSNGKVLGINTLKLVGVEGIGLAIPIETVMEEFNEVDFKLN